MSEDVDWGTYVRGTHHKHIKCYLARAEAHSGVSQAHFGALASEHSNVMQAAERACREEQWKFVLRFMSALEQYLHLQGHWGEAATCAGYALDAAAHLQDEKARAQWTFYDGLIQAEQGNYKDAEPCYRESLDLAQAEGKITIQAECWRRLGWLAHVRGERDTAKANYQQAIAFHRQANDRLGQARDWRQLAILAIEDGEFDMAQEHLQTSLVLVKGRADWQTQQLRAGVWLDMGRIALRQGRLESTRKRLECALAYTEKAPDRFLRDDIDFHLAMLAEKQGDLHEAKTQYKKLLERAKEVWDKPRQASSLIALGNLALEESDYAQARCCYENVLRVGECHDRAAAMAQLGLLAYLQKDYEQATMDLQKALETFQSIHYQQEIAICHYQLGLVAQAKRQWQKAGEHYQASLCLQLELGLWHDAVRSCYQLGTLAQQLRRYDVACRYYQQALDMGEKSNFPNLSRIRQALESLVC